MVNSRNKGAGFEREVCKALELDLGIKAKRDIEQYRAADHGDIVVDDDNWNYVIECKRYAGKGHTYKTDWWEQVEKSAKHASKEPVLIYKYDRQPITVVMRLAYVMKDNALHDEKIRMSWDAFTYIVRENM